jgi:periplasmic divalent cation tolerance protein
MTREDSGKASDFVVVFITTPTIEVAKTLAKTLVAERLAACVTMLPQAQSVYWWDGKICDDQETLCVAKTRAASFEALRARVLTLHPYQVPEIISVPLAAGHAPYLAWLAKETQPS